MKETDTSPAALDRLRERLTWHAGLHRDMGRPCSADCLNEARQMIDALAAERDEAIDQRNAADFVLALSIQQSNRHSAERDDARAEAARLREAVAKIADDARYYCDHEPVAGWLPRMKDIRDTARAALAAKEDRDDAKG